MLAIVKFFRVGANGQFSMENIELAGRCDEKGLAVGNTKSDGTVAGVDHPGTAFSSSRDLKVPIRGLGGLRLVGHNVGDE